MRSITSYLNTAAAFAAPADKGADKPETAEKGQGVVYLRGDDTIKQVVLFADNAANATAQFVGSMVVHLFTRLYTPVLHDRISLKDASAEILEAVKAHGNVAKGRDFSRAWSYKLLSLAVTIGREMQSDYTRKSGIIADSPLSGICRARTVPAALEFVTVYMGRKCKAKGENGVTNVQVLESTFAPAKARQQVQSGKKGRKGQGKGNTGNATKPATAAATAKAIMADHAETVFQAVPAKSAKQRAEKIADKVGAANNVDHVAFILRSLTFVTDPEKLVAISEKCLELAKAIGEKRDADPVPAEKTAVA